MTEYTPVTVYGECALHVVTATRPAPGLVLGPVAVAVGGPAGTVGLQLARLGHRPRLVGMCGADAEGELIRAELSHAGVDCSRLAGVGRTTRVLAVVEDGAVDLVAEPGASWTASPWAAAPPDPGPGLVYVTGFPDLVPTIQRLGASGRRLVVDVGFIPLLARPAELLRHVAAVADTLEVCVLSGADLGGDIRSAVRDLCLSAGVGTVLTTLGGGGVLVGTAAGTTHLPAYQVTAVDTLCAGDAFVAGFLCGTAEGMDPVSAADFGQAVAAAKVGLLGALPDRSAALDLIRRGPLR